MAEATKRHAVVTRANKGIGFETVRQLALHGIVVVLTARDEKRGLEALKKLQHSGLFDHVVFHQLDVSDPASITSFADFMTAQFGKLDILVNNAGVLGAIVDGDALLASGQGRYAVVTGANKGIGFETVRQLASNGIVVVLTARDEKRGLEALEKLQHCGLSDHIVFHPLDVSDPVSITCFADFIKTQFGKLDILVNNAGIMGAKVDFHAISSSISANAKGQQPINWSEVITQTYEPAVECVQTNYYGAKRIAELLIPLLQLSDSPRIVNVSSSAGKLEGIGNEWAKGILIDDKNLTEERVDEVLREFLKDFKEGSLETKGWPSYSSAYVVSKAALNAYTRILAKRYPSFCINCVCPGFIKTDINHNTGILSVEEGAAHLVRLALLPNGDPSGIFYIQQEVSPF